MKKLLSILILCLGCFGILEAQNNIWKPINGTGILGAGSDGSIFAYGEYGALSRSQDEGETWQIVLGQETGFTGFINSSCFAVSNEGRICVFNDNQQAVVYSDDAGDTWQQTTALSLCGLPTKAGICAPTNDVFVVWAENGEISYTLDGGETWDGWILDFLENAEAVSDLLVNETGDVYVSVAYYIMNIVGIYHSTLSDIQNWELVAFEGISIKDMAFDPEGNVVACGYNADGSSAGFQHIPGFYLFDGTTLAISDGGIVYRPHFVGNQAVLSYSIDHGEHFTDIGEHVPLVDIAPGGDAFFLIKGYDNHLYFDGGGNYWKCIPDADHIGENFPLENTAWVQFYRSMYEDSTYYQLGIKGDTVVNETAYKKVINCAHLGYPIEGECFGGIREDEDGKCYFMSFVPGIDAPWPLHYDCEVNTEYPLYDFSLSVCDVFQTIGLTPHVVFDTAEMTLNGSTRKVLWFDTNCDNGNPYYCCQWIEGIGSTHSLLYPIQDEPDNGPEYRLVEVWQDEELLYRNPHFNDYVPLVHEGNDRQKWNVVYIGSMNYPNDYHTEIQSIRDNINLDGVDYKLVWKEDVYDSKRIAGAVREEDKRVYYRMYWQQSYQNEVLLYDFNLTVGDTVTVGWSDYQLIVLEESEIEVNGTMRRQLGLAMYFDDGTTGEVEEYWIEGVGSTYGFLNSGYEGWVGAFVHLLCYYENGNLVWDNEEFDDCVMNSDGAPASFAPQEAEWYFDVFNPWGTHPEYERFFVDGDTIIQGHQCSIISQHFVDTGHDGEEYVYEEDNKVYWFNPTTNAFSTLYDFDAEAGESWYYEVGSCSHLVTVDSVGSVTWDGRTYRTQWVKYNDYQNLSTFRGKIIEGIGYEKGLFPSVWTCNGEIVYDASEIEYLRCYVENGEMVYHEGSYDCDETGNTGGDEMLEAYCEAPRYFYGYPNIEQGTCMTQMLWNRPLGSKWFHYDEKPYAGSVWCNYWGIKIPAEEIQSGDVLTHVAFYKAGFQNHLAHYVFAFSVGGDTEPDNLDFLPGNTVQIEPGPDEWVMVELRHPIECEEGKSLWIILTAPNVEVNNAAYCQTSGNSDGRWASSSGGYWYDYSSVQGGGGDWMIRGYFNNWGYCNEDFDHYNLYRGRSLEELEKIAELDRDEVEYNDTLQNPFGDYYYSLTASYTDGRESDPEEAYGYFHVGNMSSLGSEWYYEIQNEDGSITYQHLEYASDTTVNDKEVKIIIRTNTLYDKGRSEEKTREYIYEDFGKVYWWNETRQDFTLLYDLGAQIGDEWTIWVGTESITMHVDTVEQYEYEGTTYRMLRVSDANGLFSGEILSGIGHLTSFFPERLMTRGEKYRVEGIRCYWREGDLVFKYGDRDCNEVYEQYHFGIEEDGPSTGSGTLTIYPNPTDGVLTIHHSSFSIHHSEFRITNLMGQTVLTGSLNAETQQIDVSNLPQGMYFISVGDVTQKFVVR